MSDHWLTAAQAATLLDVKRATLYAYVSRGLVRSRAAAPGQRARRYHRADLERLRERARARSGHGAVAQSAMSFGEPILDSALTETHPAGHAYRGYRVSELARHYAGDAGLERVAALLWSGRAPEESPERWPSPVPGRRAPADVAADASIIEQVLLALPTLPRKLAALTPDASAPSAAVQTAQQLTAQQLTAQQLTAQQLMVALTELSSGGGDAPTIAGRFTRAVGGGRTARRAIDTALMVMADHGLNVSTFSARIAASAGADLIACVTAGVAAFSGPRHGGQAALIASWLADMGPAWRAPRAVGEALDRGETIPGFDHPLYPDGDPRVPLLLDAARSLPLAEQAGPVFALLDAVALAGGPPPNCDVALTALALALNQPAPFASRLFLVGRAVGWVAHVFEERQRGGLLRPTARYVGPTVER